MAEYIYETGDENTVTTTIENYLDHGIVSTRTYNVMRVAPTASVDIEISHVE